MGVLKGVLDVVTFRSQRPLLRLVAYYAIMSAVLFILFNFFPDTAQPFAGDRLNPTQYGAQLLQDGLATKRVGKEIAFTSTNVDPPKRLEFLLVQIKLTYRRKPKNVTHTVRCFVDIVHDEIVEIYKPGDPPNVPPIIDGFTSDSNGMPSLVGVSLANTNIREAVFQGMGAVGIKASIEQPQSFTNMAQESNFLETLDSMRRAGLFITNAPAKPNPYE